MTNARARELPAYDQHVLGAKRSDLALVVPVINEGDRIRAQLRRIGAARLEIDVVIADGGSTDGSLDCEFLNANGVRALLVKRGAGALSAQLRIAYAWCLDEGYEGVITIDGNGKDGIEAIPLFMSKLRDGFDYVQGSRYLAGGKATNTPLDRRLAGRLIHAPLLSLAAGRWYTDTTNGFRGYSRRYLEDPRVNPFRNVFDRYQLLFYLTARAGQLGFRSTEVPVSRCYAPSGGVPTKIRGLAGRLQHLAELIQVAVGRFKPR